MASQAKSGKETEMTAEEFLAKHPDILVGRDALNEARAKVANPGDTFDIVKKPLKNVVLVQQFHADTKERLFAVALIDDEKAEEYYKEHCDDGDGNDTCDRAAEEGPSHSVFTHASETGHMGQDGK